ncbi:MAG: polysaccharide pyruvyl transferase family protein [Aliihoeflea sp.]|uniref:polysaccharide pyruvyl transferase family protein n=1 Tax=Aliihoeflea sp. TaxID=2608088 RepID=UPI0040340D24
MKIAITNYTGDRQNWGCQSTSRGLERFLTKHAPGAEITTLPLRSKFPDLKGIPRAELRQELDDILHGRSQSLRIARAIYTEEELHELEHADLVLFQGEGTMVGTTFYNGENLLVAPIVCTKLFEKPVWSINQTVFSIEPTFTGFMAEVYRTVFERNFVREAASRSYLQEMGVECSLVPDMAFYDDLASDGTQSAASGTYAALSGMARIERLPEATFLNIAGQLIDRYSRVVIVASTNMDTEMAARAKARFGDQLEIIGADQPRQRAYEAIRDAEVFVSGRYHMNIFAAKAVTPFLSFLSNTHKNHGLNQMLGYPLSPKLLDENYDLRADLDWIEAHRDELVGTLVKSRDAISRFLDSANIFEASSADVDFRPTGSVDEPVVEDADYFRVLNGPKPVA